MNQPYQPSVQPTPKKRSRRRLWIVLGIIVVALLLSCTLYGIIGSHLPTQITSAPTATSTTAAAQVVTQAPTQPASTPTPVPSPTATPKPTPTPNPHGDIGISASVGNWIVTLNKVSTATSGPYASAKAGDIFVIVDVTASNISSSKQLLSSGALFIFQDMSGQSYDETVTGIGVPPDGDVQSGEKLRGQIVYEVSRSLHDFTLQFQDKLGNGDAATWHIHV